MKGVEPRERSSEGAELWADSAGFLIRRARSPLTTCFANAGGSHSTLRATLKVVLTVWVAYSRGGVFRSGGLNSARNRFRRSAEYQTGAYSSSNWQTSANRRCALLNRRFSVLSILDVGCFAVTIWNVNWVVLLHNNSPQVGRLQARACSSCYTLHEVQNHTRPSKHN